MCRLGPAVAVKGILTRLYSAVGRYMLERIKNVGYYLGGIFKMSSKEAGYPFVHLAEMSGRKKALKRGALAIIWDIMGNKLMLNLHAVCSLVFRIAKSWNYLVAANGSSCE